MLVNVPTASLRFRVDAMRLAPFVVLLDAVVSPTFVIEADLISFRFELGLQSSQARNALFSTG